MISDGFPYQLPLDEAEEIIAWHQNIPIEDVAFAVGVGVEKYYHALNFAYRAGARDASALLWRADA